MTLDTLINTPRSPGRHFLVLQKEGEREELQLEKGAWGRNKSQPGPGRAASSQAGGWCAWVWCVQLSLLGLKH